MNGFLRSLIAEVSPQWMSTPPRPTPEPPAPNPGPGPVSPSPPRPAPMPSRRQVEAFRQRRRPDLASNM